MISFFFEDPRYSGPQGQEYRDYGIIPFFGTAKVRTQVFYAKPFLKIFAVGVMNLGGVGSQRLQHA